jgi:hypothetical protein
MRNIRQKASFSQVINKEAAPMLDTTDTLSLLTLAEIIGPIVLGLALVYGIYRSRRSRRTAPRDPRGTIYAQDRK